MNYDKIGEFIKEKRKEKNLTQVELANKIGVTDKAISKWERGNGCPDVSILEILSKELGCSILELLKGRIIENEIIPITEANEFIKESLSLQEKKQKQKTKQIINKIIESIVLFIASLLIFLNLLQIVYLNKYYSYDKPTLPQQEEYLERNIQLINKNQGIFKSNDYNRIKEELNNAYYKIQNSKIYSYMKNKEEIKFRLNEFHSLSRKGDTDRNIHRILEVLQRYEDNKLVEYFENASYIAQQDSIMPALRIEQSYEYNFNLTNNYNENELTFLYIITNTNKQIYKLLYITELIKEVGDIHE